MRLTFYAMRAAFRQECRFLFPKDLIFGLVAAVGPAIITGWIIRTSDDAAAAAYLLIGAPLYSVWAQGVSRVAGSLQGEAEDGCLEPMLTTRNPLFLTMLAKALAVSFVALLPGALVLGVLIASSPELTMHGSPLLILPSALLAVVALVVTALSFQRLTFLAGGRPNAVTAIMPVGAVLAGFLYPTSLLPGALEAAAHLLPIAWAMEALAAATRGEGLDAVGPRWLEAMAASAIVLAATSLAFGRAERVLRRSGVLGRF